MKQSSTSRHFYSLTTPILNLRLPKLNLPLILYKKRALPPLPLLLHLCPTWSALQAPCKIPLKNHPLLSPHIHLTIQGKSLLQIQIIYQVTFPELKPYTIQDILQLNKLHKNLHQLFLYPKNLLYQWKYPNLALSTSIWGNTRISYLTSCSWVNFPLSQWISPKLTI